MAKTTKRKYKKLPELDFGGKPAIPASRADILWREIRLRLEFTWNSSETCAMLDELHKIAKGRENE